MFLVAIASLSRYRAIRARFIICVVWAFALLLSVCVGGCVAPWPLWRLFRLHSCFQDRGLYSSSYSCVAKYCSGVCVSLALLCRDIVLPLSLRKGSEHSVWRDSWKIHTPLCVLCVWLPLYTSDCVCNDVLFYILGSIDILFDGFLVGWYRISLWWGIKSRRWREMLS